MIKFMLLGPKISVEVEHQVVPRVGEMLSYKDELYVVAHVWHTIKDQYADACIRVEIEIDTSDL